MVFYHESSGDASPRFYMWQGGFMVFSWEVWASLPCYRSATPSGVKRRLLS